MQVCSVVTGKATPSASPIRPFGGRKLLFLWNAIAQDMPKVSLAQGPAIPMAGGGMALA